MLQVRRPEGVRRNALRAQRPKSPHFEESAQALNKDFCGLSVAVRLRSDRFQVSCGLRDHFATTVAHLSPSCALSVVIVYLILFVPLYIIVMPYLRHCANFVPKICKFVGSSSIYDTREV